MEYRIRIAPAGNTYNPSLLVLQNKGYRLWAENDEDRMLWNAEKDDAVYTGYSPPELLGLVAVCRDCFRFPVIADLATFSVRTEQWSLRGFAVVAGFVQESSPPQEQQPCRRNHRRLPWADRPLRGPMPGDGRRGLRRRTS